ncbi:CHAT domain-containing protein [Nakamurella sp.]|uniref:CHAT domain-containing protein n=1 Tax=Nakamurella sp. TaxID=1869182 RepID=UPI003B3B053E
MKRQSRLSADQVQSDILEFFKYSLPSLPSSGLAALATIDIAKLGIQIATLTKNWPGVCQSGVALAASVVAVRQQWEGVNDKLERELGRCVGPHLDQFIFALTQVTEACHVGIQCDMLLDGGFVGRQILQTANPEAQEVWDWATGLVANGSADLSDDELRAKIAEGAWLSVRQRIDLDPSAAVETIMTWGRQVLEVMSSAPPLPLVSGGQNSAWTAMLNTVEMAQGLEPQLRVPFATVTGSLTPLAACESGRDIIYLIAGFAAGAAVRYFGGQEYRKPPESLQIPGASVEFARQVDGILASVGKLPPEDLVGRSALIDHARSIVGAQVFEPILEEWPDIEKPVFIPVGEMQTIPISAALFRGRSLNAQLDATIAPNAAAVLVAAGGRSKETGRVATVMADPANGEIAIPWVVAEATQVAAVYAQRPDLIVQYEGSSGFPQTGDRSTLTAKPLVNATSDHVLAQIEDAQIVHLACHGYLPKGEGLPGLLLHGNLTFDALEHHRFADGATVVLSACSVGRSISEAPFAQLGFPAMLLSAGACEVVASAQPLLDCRQTVDLMVSLHEYLRDGASASRALAQAIKDSESHGVPSAVWGSLEVYGARPK